MKLAKTPLIRPPATFSPLAVRRFCGLSLEGATPDETTLCRFRNDLKASGLGEPLFAEVSRQFEAAGLTLRSGTLIDATLVESAVRSPAPGTTAKGEESRSPHDGDANWTRQGQSRRLFFGYKVHVGVDLGSGLIRSRLVTPAKTYESEVADQLIIGDEAAVYADKAYEKKTRRAALKARGIKDRIQHLPVQLCIPIMRRAALLAFGCRSRSWRAHRALHQCGIDQGAAPERQAGCLKLP